MNFREIYKSANDEIHGDRSLIDMVFEKAEKKPAFKTVYPVACVAAALLIVVTVSLHPADNKKETPNFNIASNNDANKTEVNPKTEQYVQKETGKQPDDTTKKYAEESVITEKSDANSKSEGISDADNKTTEMYEESSEEDRITEDTVTTDNFMVAMLDINDVQPGVSAAAEYKRSSGGAGASDSIEFEGMTAEQYYEYIGADITQKIKLPADMHFEEFFGATVKRNTDTDTVISDDAEFYAVGDNKYLSVSTAKVSGEAESKLNDESLKKSDISGIPAVIEGFESTYRIYVKAADVYYNIYSDGLTQEEIKELLLSICKN